MAPELSRRDFGLGMGTLAFGSLLPQAASAAPSEPPRNLEDFFGEANMADLQARFFQGRFWTDTPKDVPQVLSPDGRFRLSAEARWAYAALLFEGREAQFPAPHAEAESHNFIIHALRRYGLVGNLHIALEAWSAAPPRTEIIILTAETEPSRRWSHENDAVESAHKSQNP